MTNQVITCLHENIVFIEDFQRKNFIIIKLFMHDIATLIERIPSKIINPDISKRITHNEEIAL